MHDVTFQPSDELVKKLQEERKTRKLDNLPQTVTVILKEYFTGLKAVNTKKAQDKKNIIRKARGNKYVHYFLIALYLVIILAVLVNIENWSIPYLNVVQSTINRPTDYRFLQTYPPSIDGYQVGNTNETITFQVHIHADTMITENTEVNIDAEAGIGSTYVNNMSALGVGFFGADYIGSEQVTFTPAGTTGGYELWTGWAGERLYKGVKPETLLLLMPAGGVAFGGFNSTVFWTEAGDKPVNIVFEWKNSSVFSSYTYPFSTVHVYAYADIRASQIAYTELIVAFGVSLFGAFEVYPSIVGRRKD